MTATLRKNFAGAIVAIALHHPTRPIDISGATATAGAGRVVATLRVRTAAPDTRAAGFVRAAAPRG